jgi:hypothetical protein
VPYVFNVLVVGSATLREIESGRLRAEADEPAVARLVLDHQVFRGTRYLLVTDDGQGYWSSIELVDIPRQGDAPSVLQLKADLQADFKAILGDLMQESPASELLVYLEANRIISRADPSSEQPANPTLHGPLSLGEFLEAISRREVVEEQVYLVRGSPVRT